MCDSLSSRDGALRDGCTEPELDTVEVLNSFLLHRPDALYVDIGCNIGYHAAHAAALGALVECYEPTPMYAHAIMETRTLNGVSARRWTIHNAAVVPEGRNGRHNSQRFHIAYQPCGIGSWAVRHRRFWDAPTVPLVDLLKGRRITLLKIDIDSVEGKMLHTVERALARGEADVETILVELGDNDSSDAWCTAEGGGASQNGQAPICPPLPVPKALRGGSTSDVYKLLHEHGYDVYRVNVHTGREVYDWGGRNVNTRMAPTPEGLEPMFFVRGMRKLEKLSKSLPLEKYPQLFRWGQSYLFTKLELASVAKHHWFDLINMEHGSKTVFRKKMARWQNASEWARLVRSRLNDGLPPEREPAAAVQS